MQEPQRIFTLLLDLDNLSMNNTRKKTAFVLSLVLVVVLLFASFAAFSPKEIKQPVPFPTPTLVPKTFPTFTPIELLREKEVQQNYAEEREQFLEEHPWFLELPLQHFSYFISYDSEKDEFLATIYFYPKSSFSKEEQLDQARKNAAEAIKNLTGSDFYTNRVVFFETEWQ